MRIVVSEWERVLEYRDGRFTELLEPGLHRRGRRRRQHVRVSVRPRLVAVPGQEVLTADQLSVKVSLLARLRTADPRRWYESVDSAEAFVHAVLQLALRDAVAGLSVTELLAERAALGDRMRAAVADDAAAVGVAVERLDVRDVMLPADVRRAAAELASARAQGEVALERARSEVAATRALANAARVLADQPALLQLRTLQAVETSRATVLLSTAPSAPPEVLLGARPDA